MSAEGDGGRAAARSEPGVRRRRGGDTIGGGDTIEGISARQDGVISRAQATAAGLSPGDVDHLLRRRQWRPIHPRIYLTDARPAGARTRMQAALLWAGDGAVLGGSAAAWWRDLLAHPPPIVGVFAAGLVGRPPPGIAVLPGRLDQADVDERHGLLVTTPARTVLDLALELQARPDFLARVVLGGIPADDLRAAAARHPAGWARRLVTEALADAGRVRDVHHRGRGQRPLAGRGSRTPGLP
jgi:hypothetical protein